eukprot:3714274-Amphidinium_carterae.2
MGSFDRCPAQEAKHFAALVNRMKAQGWSVSEVRSLHVQPVKLDTLSPPDNRTVYLRRSSSTPETVGCILVWGGRCVKQLRR